MAAAVLLALLVLAGPGAAEQMPATPTDLTPKAPEPDCPHENVTSVIYFFDSPSYTSLSAAISAAPSSAFSASSA